jgi:hypothetical protein
MANEEQVDRLDEAINLLQTDQRSRTLKVALRVAEVGRKDITAKEWDSFAEMCDASFICSYKASTFWQLDEHVWFKTRRFEIYTREPSHKIGQCAVGVGHKINVFADSLQLLPQFEYLWEDVMIVLLAKIGPGSYRYGSIWNTEPPREETLQYLDGVRMVSVDSLIVQAIEFSRWSSWNGYLQHVSQNARRNAARAIKTLPTLQVRMRRRFSTLLDLPALISLSFNVRRRKQLAASPLRMILRLILRLTIMDDYEITAVATDKRRPLAVFSAIEFGASTYYLTGGSARDNGGAAWHLLLTMIRRAYDRAPAGKFVMGFLQEDIPGWANLARSREQCRVSNIATSIIMFEFSRSPSP